ncbi:MAG: hypothetical protein IPN00_03020 [Hydrogenophilales bacterium]|jgi:hypothetical protein|nr:hypothetical protein [Hydrogenophilales bacterium]
MQEKHGPEFWIGNALLGLSLIMLIFLGALWEALGVWAMMLWMVLAGVGMYFVTRDKGPGSNLPD